MEETWTKNRGGIIKGQGGAKAPPTVFGFTFFSIYLKNNI